MNSIDANHYPFGEDAAHFFEAGHVQVEYWVVQTPMGNLVFGESFRIRERWRGVTYQGKGAVYFGGLVRGESFGDHLGNSDEFVPIVRYDEMQIGALTFQVEDASRDIAKLLAFLYVDGQPAEKRLTFRTNEVVQPVNSDVVLFSGEVISWHRAANIITFEVEKA